MFSDLWNVNAALFERLMAIHSNPPILYYGFKQALDPWDFLLVMCTHIICAPPPPPWSFLLLHQLHDKDLIFLPSTSSCFDCTFSR